MKRKRLTERQRINAFIKKNKEQIISKGLESVGLERDAQSEKIILKMFKNEYKERLNETLEGEGRVKAKVSDIEGSLKRTLHTHEFTGEDTIDVENMIKGLKSDGQWDVFRKLNRNQKYSLDQFSRIKTTENHVRQAWQYQSDSRTIIIKLIYEDDGSYRWSLSRM